MQKKYYLGVDLGGTKVALGLVDEDGRLVSQTEFPTIRDESALASEIYEHSKQLVAQNNITMDEIISMGIGVPGTVDSTKKVIVYANNMDFVMVPMVELLEAYFSCPVYMDNDANVAAWAEYKAGAGKQSQPDSMIMVTLGTGVGAGFVINGQIFSGCNQGAGEIGHMVIDMHGIPCNCGRRGCFENYASATALISQTKTAMEENRESILWTLCDQDINALNGKIFFKAVEQNDATAKKVLQKFQEYLAVGLLNLINSFQPDLIVIGGGISRAGDVLLDSVKKEVSKLVYTKDDAIQTKLEQARLGNEAGIIGAAFLQNRKV